jgi:DNA-binding transcriptional ArsR family regulator
MREPTDKAEQTAEIHRVLANPRRLKILRALGREEMSVGELADLIGASLPCTSQHLRLMREHGMVCTRREGQTIYYHISGPAGELVPNWLDSPVDFRGQGVSDPRSQHDKQGDSS